MKNTSYISGVVLFAALATLAAGCKPSSDDADARSANAIDNQLEEVRTSAKDAASDLSAYTYTQKEQFVSSMEAQLVKMENSLEKLSASIADSSVAVKAEAEPKLAALRVRMAALEKQLESVKRADASTWEMVKTTTGQAYDDLKESFNDTRQWLSDKLDP